MIEAGLSLIAACLPTLQSLFPGIPAQRILNSVRSLFSLHSQRSSHDRSRVIELGQQGDAGSATHFVRSEVAASHNVAFESESKHEDGRLQGLFVKRSVEQTSEFV